MQKVKVNILTQEDGWLDDIELEVDNAFDDFDIDVTIAATIWCSDKGYTMDTWELPE